MAFCSNCGTNIGDGVKFCPGCGKSADENSTSANSANTNSANTAGTSEALKNLLDSNDRTSEFDPQDIANNKLLSLFSYIGILFIIPLLGAPNSKYARFHANQGVILFIILFAINIVYRALSIITEFIGIFAIILVPVAILSWLPWALTVYGIFNAVTGKARELPIIGKFKVLK